MNALATITVTHRPDIDVLRRQLHALPADALKILVDNASSADAYRALEQLRDAVPRTVLLGNRSNAGLGAALNQGVDAAAAHGCTRVLLLDQDTEPAAGSVERMLLRFDALRQTIPRLGAVGPRLRDPDSGAEHGFHVLRHGIAWTRIVPPEGDAAPIAVDSLNGSGTLTTTELFRAVGGVDAAMFIDHLDTDWSFRMLAAGWRLYGLPEAVFVHRMGEATRRIWLFGWRAWPSRSPLRHRYLFRNTVRLLGRRYVPFGWKLGAAVKLLVTAAIVGITDPRRGEQLASMAQGIRAAFARR